MVQTLKAERRNRIERASLEEFYQKGFENASMREIAKKAQISTSNLYNYFESKEELFYEITDEIYQKINNLFFQLINAEKVVGVPKFFEQITDRITKPIGELIKKYRLEFLIILEKSQGSRYENYKEELVEVIEQHFIKDIQSKRDTQIKQLTDTFIMHIIARNLLETLIEISKHYKNDKWVDYNIDLFLKYHLNGIKQFFN